MTRANPQHRPNSAIHDPVRRASLRCRTMRAALAVGCDFWNGGEFYGPPDHNSMTLLKKYYERYPEDVDKVALNVKRTTRMSRAPGAKLPTIQIDGSPENMRESVAHCLEMLGGRGRIDVRSRSATRADARSTCSISRRGQDWRSGA